MKNAGEKEFRDYWASHPDEGMGVFEVCREGF